MWYVSNNLKLDLQSEAKNVTLFGNYIQYQQYIKTWNSSFLWAPDLAKKSRKKRKVEVDELTSVRASDKIFDVNYISTDNAPDNYSFKRFDIIVHFPNLIFNEETFALAHHKCISIDCYFQICLCQDRSWHYLF